MLAPPPADSAFPDRRSLPAADDSHGRAGIDIIPGAMGMAGQDDDRETEAASP